MRSFYIFCLGAFLFCFTQCKKDDGGTKVTPPIEEPVDTTSPDLYPYTDTVSVVTLNVAGLPEGLSSGNPVKNTSEIGRRLNVYELVAVQEDFNYNHLLYGTAKHKYKTNWMGPVPFGDGLNLLSQYKISGLKRFKWKKCNGADCLTPKGFSYQQIEIFGGVKIDVYNMHANAGSAQKDYEARRANLIQIFEYIDENSKDRPVILLGDFNSRYTRAVDTLEIFNQIGFTDTWIEIARNGSFPIKGSDALMECENPSSGICETVDKIFYRSNDQVKFRVLDYQKPRVDFQRDGEDLSDHIPVSSIFEIKILYK